MGLLRFFDVEGTSFTTQMSYRAFMLTTLLKAVKGHKLCRNHFLAVELSFL